MENFIVKLGIELSYYWMNMRIHRPFPHLINVIAWPIFIQLIVHHFSLITLMFSLDINFWMNSIQFVFLFQFLKCRHVLRWSRSRMANGPKVRSHKITTIIIITVAVGPKLEQTKNQESLQVERGHVECAWRRLSQTISVRPVSNANTASVTIAPVIVNRTKMRIW